MKSYIKIIYIYLFLSLLAGCATTKPKAPPATPTQTKTLEKIKLKFGSTPDQEIAYLLKFVSTNPESDATVEAHFILGDLYYQKKDFPRAIQHYRKSMEIDSPFEPRARINLARAFVQSGHSAEARDNLIPVLKRADLPPETSMDAQKVMYMAATQAGDRLQALSSLIFVAEHSTNPQEKEGFRQRAMDLVESKLTDEETKSVADNSSFGFTRGAALFRLGNLAFEQGDFDRAKSYLSSSLGLLPAGALYDRATEIIEQINSRRRVNSRVVGAILPLSGKNAKIGYKTLHGIQMGLGILGPHKSDITLAVMDSEGSPELARRAFKKLVMEDHPIALIGSLLSRTALPIATKAQEYGIPTVGLSQKAGITDVGNYVFRNALTSEMQVRQLVDAAMTEKKWSKFAILYPNDPYGVEFANLFWDEVLARGGQIVGAQAYDSKETDFRGPVRRLVGTYYIENRAAEYSQLLQAWQSKDGNKKTSREVPSDLLPPVIDFDALFIPDGTKAVAQIGPMLVYNDVNQVALMGTNLWNSPDILSRGDKYVEGSLFVDSALPDPKADTIFLNDFQRTFAYSPDNFELQAYDTALMLRTLLDSGISSRAELQSRLSSLSQFKGSVGPLSMSPRREVYRPLVTYTVDHGEIKALK